MEPIRPSLMPKHAHLRRTLAGFILDGTWSDGERVPSETQLSKKFGVSRTTVIRALRDMERDGLVSRRQGSGTYVRNGLTGQSSIGVLIPGLAPDDIFLSVQRHIFRESSRFNWQVLNGEVLLPGDTDAAGHAPVEAAKKLVQTGICGVVLVPHHVQEETERCNEAVLNVFRSAKLPVVLLDRDIYEAPHRSPHDLVSLDNSRAGFELAYHLMSRDRARFVYVGDPHVYPSTHARLSGVRKALSLEGISLADECVLPGSEEGYTAVIEKVRTDKIDAVICNSDHDAALVMRKCLEAGFEIPKQVAIAGFDDQPIAKLLNIPLTTVAQPAQGLAVRVISTLRDRIEYPDLPPTTVRIQGELIVREST